MRASSESTEARRQRKSARDQELDDRKAAILEAVVQEYVETAQPVGSSRVARVSNVQVSPATVRNEMAILEQEGFLRQPHTSAGRIPTEKGYRFFVDRIESPGPLDPTSRQKVSSFFAHAHGEIEQMLEDTSRLLASVTDTAAVVVAPTHESATIRSAQIVGLSDRVGLLVVVLSDGVVHKHTFELPEGADEVRLGAATAHLCRHLVGSRLGELASVAPTGDATTDLLVSEAVDAIAAHSSGEPESVYVVGASRMAAAFDVGETLKQVLSILEQQLVVVSLIRDLIDRGLEVAIGTETGIRPLRECSIVVAPYEVGGEQAGTIGVLGPTRMNYEQAMAAVAVVSNRLSRALGGGAEDA